MANRRPTPIYNCVSCGRDTTARSRICGRCIGTTGPSRYIADEDEKLDLERVERQKEGQSDATAGKP